ncbi:hypothetical protein GCM10010182_15920 [Actinomadura cremea]|nr:hypothetical protein GCM10010182_15920 [Actinomadura cremea]
MSNEHGTGRRRFLAGAGALGAAAVAAGAGTAFADARRTASGGRPGLRHRGVCYAVESGETPATGWNAARMRADMAAIADGLHASTVVVFGDGVERLAATAEEAAGRGLHVWLQPRLADRPHGEILDHLAETGRRAERMRRQGARVHLSVGCEFILFVPGIVPGDNALERIENIMNGDYDPRKAARRRRAFTARAAAVGRSVFNGRLTYGAASDEADEGVDWDLFDIVSVNYYSYHPDRAGYVRELRKYQRFGKPVAISECGTCTFEFAGQTHLGIAAGPRRLALGAQAGVPHPGPPLRAPLTTPATPGASRPSRVEGGAGHRSTPPAAIGGGRWREAARLHAYTDHGRVRRTVHLGTLQ